MPAMVGRFTAALRRWKPRLRVRRMRAQCEQPCPWRGRRGGGHRRVAVDAGLGQALLVVGPQLVLLRAQEVQVVPGEDAAVVAVGEASAAPRSCRPARGRAGPPRACRSAAPPGPGRGPAPRPRASTRASARTGCGRRAPSEKPTSSTRDCAVHGDGLRRWRRRVCKPAMRVESSAAQKRSRQVDVEAVVAGLGRRRVERQRHLAAGDDAAVVDRRRRTARGSSAGPTPSAGQLVGCWA